MTLSGVVPDIDGLGVIAEIATEDSSNPVYWWSEYHHVLCHNIGFGLALAVVVAFSASRRTCTTLLAVLVFHLHLVADLVGSRGPNGYQWPIPYLLPFSNHWQLTWEGQWVLNAWRMWRAQLGHCSTRSRCAQAFSSGTLAVKRRSSSRTGLFL